VDSIKPTACRGGLASPPDEGSNLSSMFKEIYGKYFGTEIKEKWWRRYTKEKMSARGAGTFSNNDQTISFLRLLTKVPIEIN
jgi:hypothetical protein